MFFDTLRRQTSSWSFFPEIREEGKCGRLHCAARGVPRMHGEKEYTKTPIRVGRGVVIAHGGDIAGSNDDDLKQFGDDFGKRYLVNIRVVLHDRRRTDTEQHAHAHLHARCSQGTIQKHPSQGWRSHLFLFFFQCALELEIFENCAV